jgi:hypothetical protein
MIHDRCQQGIPRGLDAKIGLLGIGQGDSGRSRVAERNRFFGFRKGLFAFVADDMDDGAQA